MAVIEVNELKKAFKVKQKKQGGFWKSLFAPTYRNVNAVNKISFAINEGECVAFIGPNGAGKSTTIKMLTSILTPTSGEAKVLGFIPWQERGKLAYDIGAVFGQRSQLWYHLPAKETFNLLAAVYDIPKTTYQKRVRGLIKEFQIEEFVDKPVRSLSLGERMRCEIVASLLHDPKILFLDEPTIGLDVTAKAVIRELLKRQAKEEGKTILLTSHDTGDMESVCERVIMINHGRIIIDESVKKLKKTHFKKKLLNITANTEISGVKMPGVRIVSSEFPLLVLEVDTRQTPIEQVIQNLMKHGQLQDLTIEDPPMEEIIKEIYAMKVAE